MKIIPYNDHDEINQYSRTNKKSAIDSSFGSRTKAKEALKEREISERQKKIKMKIKLRKIEQEKYRVI
jgi:hypothetical protein